MRFLFTHEIFDKPGEGKEYTEDTLPKYLEKWFLNDHVLKLPIGGVTHTDFHRILRLE